MTNADDKFDIESNHNSIDPNEADENSSKASVHYTGSHVSVHSATSEPPHEPPRHPLNEEANDMKIPKPETQVPVLC